MYKFILKRLFDFLAALTAFFLLSPIFIVSTFLLAILNRGKPFFFQLRPGLKGKVFKIVKFKTMNNKKDSTGMLLPDGDRLTPFGNLVRRLSIDEIPQLLNVLKGDMSLVGPRPLLVEYLPLYSLEQMRRHDVKPGITGWAQVNGRNGIDWEKKFGYDVWYVDNMSFSLDLKILFLTIAKLFKPQGINSANSVTMEKFNGNQ